jgi:HemY protein
MRRLLIVIVAGLIAGAGLLSLIEQDPGHILISYGQKTLETSIWVGLVLWLGLWALAAVVLRVINTLLGTRHRLSGWLGSRKHRHAEALTNRGLVSFIEGHWERARRQLLRAARYSNAPLLNYLVAAQASFKLGDQEATQKYLGEAERVDSDALVALELTQAELQLSAGHDEQALATLVRARKNAGKHPYVLELLCRAYQAVEDWDSLRLLLPELRQHEVMSPEQLADLEVTTWRALLNSTCCDRGRDIDELWAAIPKKVAAAHPSLFVQYIDCLIQQGDTVKAERLTYRALDRDWQPELVQRLATFVPVKPSKTLTQLQHWLEHHPRDPHLLLAAGRVALYAQQWDNAQAYLQQVYQYSPSASICFELARLRDAMGDKVEAARLVSEAARRGAGDLPDTPLPTV